MEHMFQTFSSTSSVPPESKLQTYLNSMPSVDDNNYFADASLASNEANALSVDLTGKALNSDVGQFGNSVIGRMSHSLSSPSFSQYPVQHPQLVSTPFGHFNMDIGNRIARCSPQQSPLLNKRTCSPGPKDYSAPSPSHEQYIQSGAMFQESVGGTTYFYSQEETNPADISPLILPDINVYPGNPSHIEHMRPKANAPSFFLPDELRMDILHRHHLTLAEANPDQHPDLPAEVDNYHKLCPLEPPVGDTPVKSSTFGYVTSVYKAANIKTGIYYCLRRVHDIITEVEKYPILWDNRRKDLHNKKSQEVKMASHSRKFKKRRSLSNVGPLPVESYFSGSDQQLDYDLSASKENMSGLTNDICEDMPDTPHISNMETPPCKTPSKKRKRTSDGALISFLQKTGEIPEKEQKQKIT